MVDRADANLVRTVNIEWAYDCDGHAVLLEVRMQEELAGQLRDRIRPAGLADLATRHLVRLFNLVRVAPKDLTRREINEPLQLAPKTLSDLCNIRGAHQVDAHRAHRALEHRRHACDCSHMNDVRGVSSRLAQEFEVEDVALDQGDIRVLPEIRVLQRVVVQVVVEDNIVVVCQQPRNRRANKAGAAR